MNQHFQIFKDQVSDQKECHTVNHSATKDDDRMSVRTDNEFVISSHTTVEALWSLYIVGVLFLGTIGNPEFREKSFKKSVK